MRPYLVLAAVVLAGIVPFSSRAVYLDEHIFLQIARAAQTDWLFPQDTPGVFFGTPVANFAAHTHPPIGEYYLALVYALFGEFHEVLFRLFFAVFPIATVIAFYNLARRFTTQPFWVALLFALSPAFFVYSPTLMMDIPMLAFLLSGFAFYFGYTEGRKGFLVGASICFIMAVGTGYTALVPLGCFLASLLAARRPVKELASVFAGPLVLALWLAAMTIHFGEFPLLRIVQYFAAQGSLYQNLLATFSFVGAVAVFPWSIRGKRSTIAAFVILASLMTVFASWPSMAYRMWFVALASSGLAILSTFLTSARRLVASQKNNGEAFFILWVPATLLFFTLVGDMINVRYILLILPPLLLVMYRDTTRRRLAFTLVPTAVLSMMLAYADSRLVNVNREWVEETVVPLQQQGFRVWSGTESGLRFYLEQQDVPTLTTQDTRPGPGDLIVQHVGQFRYSLSEQVAPLLTVVRTFALTSSFPLRTFSQAAGAGFHDSRAGLAPFAISSQPFDQLEVAQMSPLVGAVWSPDGPIFRQTEPEMEFPIAIPFNAQIEYELEGGDGTVVRTDRGIRLIKRNSPEIVWRNFRMVPEQFGTE